MWQWLWNSVEWMSSFLWIKRKKVLVTGIDNSGKTTFLYFLSDCSVLRERGFEKCVFESLELISFDVGGHYGYLQFRSSNIRQCDYIIFMIAGNERERLEEAKYEYNLIKTYLSENPIPCLILINKQDLPDCISVEEVIDVFQLHNLATERLMILPCSLIKREGYYEGLRWILDGAPINPIRFRTAKSARK